MMKYSLVENKLPSVDQGSYMAVVQNRRTVDLNHIVNDMVKEGTGLTRPQAMAYCEKIFQIIEDYLAEGCRVTLPVASIYATIGGVFTGPEDAFQAGRHQVNIRLVPGTRLLSLRNSIKVEKLNGMVRMPQIQAFADVSDNSINQTVPGGLAVVRGSNLKFAQDDTQQGLFFVSENLSQRIKVTTFSAIKPTELHFLVPVIPAGNYYLEVRGATLGLNARKSSSYDYMIQVK